MCTLLLLSLFGFLLRYYAVDADAKALVLHKSIDLVMEKMGFNLKGSNQALTSVVTWLVEKIE